MHHRIKPYINSATYVARRQIIVMQQILHTEIIRHCCTVHGAEDNIQCRVSLVSLLGLWTHNHMPRCGYKRNTTGMHHAQTPAILTPINTLPLLQVAITLTLATATYMAILTSRMNGLELCQDTGDGCRHGHLQSVQIQHGSHAEGILDWSRHCYSNLALLKTTNRSSWLHTATEEQVVRCGGARLSAC